MPRISNTQLERLKRTVKLSALAEASGISLERQGSQLAGRCPWHKGGRERTPSFVISPDKNLWRCMAGCGGGSNVDFVMKRDGVSFVQAIEVLIAFAGQSQGEPPSPPSAAKSEPSSRRTKTAPSDEQRARTPEEHAVLDEVATYYTEILRNTPRAQAYLERRMIFDPQLVDRFRLGFSDRTLAKILPAKSSEEGTLKRRVLEELGLVNQGYELFAASIVVPILDEEGRVESMYGRRIAPPGRGTSPHRNLPGPMRGVFNLSAMAVSAEIYLAESIIDALTLIAAGFPNTIATLGVEAWTPQHLEAIERYNTKRVVIAFDADAAGDRGAAEIAERLSARGVACYRAELPRGMDVNGYAMRMKPPSKSLEIVLRKAVPMLGALPRVMPSTPASLMAPAEETTIEPVPEAARDLATSPIEAPAPRPSPTLPSAAPVPSPALPSSLLPSPKDVAVEERGEEIYLSIDDRKYRVLGMAKNTSRGSLRINLLAVRGEQYFIDSLDLCLSRPRAQYERYAAIELGISEDVIRRDLGKILLKLEELQSDRIRALLEPKVEVPPMSAEEEAAAMNLLRDPKLFERIAADLDRLGLIGEETNKLLAYVGAVSRKLPDPIAIIVQSSSAAGKSRLQDITLECVGLEDVKRVSALTNQALYYWKETELSHKVLSIAEEEGAERVYYSLKLLQSDRELVIATTIKNPDSGQLETKERKVKGPVMIFLTTTAVDVDDELLNRAFVLTVDEGRAQTQAIHRLQRQRETIEGIVSSHERHEIVSLHRNAQRLLRNVLVANPYAETLTFADDRTRTRRDHAKYLALIRAIALFRQHQKPLKTTETKLGEVLEYIEVEPADIEMANRLVGNVLSRALSDLPPQTERLLSMIERFVTSRAEEKGISRSEVRFTRRELREATSFGNTQLKTHLKRLEDLEHIMLRGGREYRFEYQLMTSTGSSLTGVETTKRSGVEATWSGVEANMVGPDLADGRGRSGVGRPSKFDKNIQENTSEPSTWSVSAETHKRPPATNGVHKPAAAAGGSS